MEQEHELLLQLFTHINKQVTATDQIQFGERRIFDHILLGKNYHVTDIFLDAVGAAVGINRKKTRQSFRRDVSGDAGWIQTDASRGNRLAVNVGGEDLHRVVGFKLVDPFLQEDGNGIGLFAGGAARYPDANGVSR